MDQDQIFKIIAVGLYFAAMLGIGLWASRKNNDLDDYMLAGRKMSPGVAALSAGASDMSGWLLMGLPGAVYAAGLVEAWIAIGLTVGAWLNWKFVAPRLRSYTEVSNNSITVPSFLENRFRDRTRMLRIVSGLIILAFFTFYVSSGMVAGGKFFESSFGSTYLFGMLLVAAITVAYTLFGGFLGASLTDVVQGLMMLLALIAVPVATIVTMGGWDAIVDSVRAADAAAGEGVDHLSLFANATWIGTVSALAWGLGYFGQPHIIVRFMAMRAPSSAKNARRVGIGWMVVSLTGAVAAGLIGIAYFHRAGVELDNSEHVVLALTQALFHPIIVGFVFAAVLAAIMSTVSSQLIVSSSAFVEDLYRIFKRDTHPKRLVLLGRVAVLVVAIIALLMALNPSDTILGLVGFAWAGFGASFGPAILLSLFWRRLTNWGALVGMVSGAVTVFVWSNFGPEIFGTTLYEIVPGFLVNLVLAVVVSRLTYSSDEGMEQEFTTAVTAAKAKTDPNREVTRPTP